jgi:hypothetical protein
VFAIDCRGTLRLEKQLYIDKHSSLFIVCLEQW